MEAGEEYTFKSARRIALGVSMVGVLGPGLVGFGLFAFAGGVVWLRSL